MYKNTLFTRNDFSADFYNISDSLSLAKFQILAG